MASLQELEAAADKATADRDAARQQIAVARNQVVEASAAHHQTVVAFVQPQATAPTAKQAKATAAVNDPIQAADLRLKKALADYEQVRRDLGLT